MWLTVYQRTDGDCLLGDVLGVVRGWRARPRGYILQGSMAIRGKYRAMSSPLLVSKVVSQKRGNNPVTGRQ